MSTPRWFQLLHYCHTRTEGRKYFGLTFPFFIGALRTPVGSVTDDNISHAELRVLLSSMIDETPDYFVLRIARCNAQPIIVAPLNPKYQISGTPVESSSQKRSTVFVASEFIPTGYEFATLLEALWIDSRDAIRAGCFSCDVVTREPRPFNKEELQMIENSRLQEFDPND